MFKETIRDTSYQFVQYKGIYSIEHIQQQARKWSLQQNSHKYLWIIVVTRKNYVCLFKETVMGLCIAYGVDESRELCGTIVFLARLSNGGTMSPVCRYFKAVECKRATDLEERRPHDLWMKFWFRVPTRTVPFVHWSWFIVWFHDARFFDWKSSFARSNRCLHDRVMWDFLKKYGEEKSWKSKGIYELEWSLCKGYLAQVMAWKRSRG